MALKNMMESIIEDKLNQLLEFTECCKCEKCKNDIMAFALNQLPSKYVNTDEGALFGKISSHESQNTIDIDVALIKAIEIVNNQPKH